MTNYTIETLTIEEEKYYEELANEMAWIASGYEVE
jgi:hypothetical protein